MGEERGVRVLRRLSLGDITESADRDFVFSANLDTQS